MRGSLRSALLRRRLVVTNERKGVRRPVVTGAVLVAILSAVGLMLTGTAAGVTGGDVSLDLTASAPLTYSHLTGGGAFDDRTIGRANDVVESLEGGDFACNDIVSYLTQISVDSGATGASTIEIDYSFLADTTGQSGIGLIDVVGVAVNYGAIHFNQPLGGPGTGALVGDGPGGTDSGIVDDGGSTATFTETPPSNPLFKGTTDLLSTVTVTDVEPGEKIVLRVDVRLGCRAGTSPTGNLQASITDARVVGDGKISAGNQ